MNVLIFVMTMLMLLALMTYSRLETFRSSQVFQSIFKHYMENNERGYFNVQAGSIYGDIKVSTKAGKPGPKVEGSPRLGISLLLDKKKRDASPKEWSQTKILLKNLLNELYKDQPFYKTALDKRPTIADDLIDAIVKTADGLPKEKKMKTAADLANLKLEDADLDNFLYKILQGAVYHDVNAVKEDDLKSSKDQESNDEQASTDKPESDSPDDQSLEDEKLEFKSIRGYYSLLDFVTNLSKPKIRVYLASKEVLKAVFPNSQTVDEIINERTQYYKRAVKGEDPKVLSESFKSQFEKLKGQDVDDESLNFTVTKTNPKNYE